MKDRIKYIRKTVANMNQTKFGEIIGVKQGTVAAYESGDRTPIDAVVVAICREFDINETWLRTGEGEMQREISDSEKILAWVTDVLMDKPDSFRRQLVEVLVELTPEQLDIMNQVADKLIEKRTQKKEEQ